MYNFFHIGTGSPEFFVTSSQPAHFGRPCWSVHRSGRVCPGSAEGRSRRTSTGVLEPHGVDPQALTLLGGATFITWRLRRPFYGNVNGVRGIFGDTGRAWATAQRPDPPKKALCHAHPVLGTYDKYLTEFCVDGSMLNYKFENIAVIW